MITAKRLSASLEGKALFRPFTKYKHENCTDVCIEVVKAHYVLEKDVYKLKVMWWNITGKGYMMMVDSIEVKGSDAKKWKIFTT